jgi:hypothetical protein
MPLADKRTDEDVKDDEPAAPKARPVPVGLLEQARALDAQHPLAHHGKPISRDNLKARLSIATDKATTLVRIVRAEHDPPAATDPDDQQATTHLPRAA